MKPPRFRLAVAATHPIQYHAPLFRRLAHRGAVSVHVFYSWTGLACGGAFDRGFGRQVSWDLPLLDGYEFSFVPNRSNDPGTHRFSGLRNPELVPRILAWKPDALLVYGWAYRSHFEALRALHGRVPIFFRGDSTNIDSISSARRLARTLWLRYVYRHIDVALYPGKNNREYFLSHGLGPERLAWAPHSIDNARFADPDGTRATAARVWRRQMGIPDGATTILFVGKLEPKKAPDVLLDAFLLLRDPTAHLIFAGSGPMQPALTARSAADRRVHFIGFQNQSAMPTVYRLGDIFCLPSRGPGETWGLAANEAMASGLPIVLSTAVGCAPDLLDHGSNGFLVARGDSKRLANALACLVENCSLRAAMGVSSQTRIAHWSIEETAAQVENHVTEWLLKAHARSR